MKDSFSHPIYLTSVHQQIHPGIDQPFTYARDANPTVNALEEIMADLESAKSALCFSSGMSAILTIFLSLISVNDHLICDRDVYPGTARLLLRLAHQYKLSISWVDLTNPAHLEKAIRKNTRVIYFETPSTPALKLIDIQMVSTLAQRHGIITVVDNTLLTPALQRPLDYGIDVSLYSTTKYIDGHNSTMGGAVVSNNAQILKELRFFRNAAGTIQSPWNAWLISQGIRTLALRLKQHCDNARVVANYLSSHPYVTRVAYPGLTSFKGYDLAKRQQKDSGGVLSFELDLNKKSMLEFLRALETVKLAGSFGTTTTLMTHPATMFDLSHFSGELETATPPETLLRLSLGLENAQLIIDDLERAFTTND